jgi:hypothetical protein
MTEMLVLAIRHGIASCCKDTGYAPFYNTKLQGFFPFCSVMSKTTFLHCVSFSVNCLSSFVKEASEIISDIYTERTQLFC